MNRPRRVGVAVVALATCSLIARSIVWSGETAAPDDAANDLLRDRQSPEVADRVAGAIDLVGELYLEDEIAARVKEWLAQENEPWVRYHLLEALVEREEEDDAVFILTFLEDPDPTLRAVAIRFAGLDCTPGIESTLVSLYEAEDLWWVREAIIGALDECEGAASLDLLVHALEDPSRDVQASAVGALAGRADRRSLPALIGALERGTLVGEDSPAGALGRIGDPSAAKALEKAVLSDYPPVRQAAAAALADVGSTGSADLLVDLLDDPEISVGTTAASGLVRLGIGAAAARVMIFLAKHPDRSTLESLAWMEGVDIGAVCRELLASGHLEGDNAARVAEMCATIEDRRRKQERHITSGCELRIGWSEYQRFNADTRKVVPTEGLRAIAWENAPAFRNGGTRHRLDTDTDVKVLAGALYLGETWLQVWEPDRGMELWIREADLRPVDPDEALTDR